MFNFESFGSSELILIPSVAPLCMEPCSTKLFAHRSQDSDRSTRPCPHSLCRLDPSSNHARWPDSAVPQGFQLVWFDPPYLETGVVAVFAFLFFSDGFFFHQGMYLALSLFHL